MFISASLNRSSTAEHRPARLRRRAFTLVELLVVIGIIALLISILLPTLSRAREQANALKCLSNVRQLGLATVMFAQEHKGYMPTCSDTQYAAYADPYRTKFVYRDTGSGGSPVLFDSYSSLLPYLGSRASNATFITAPNAQSKIFICPSDNWQNGTLQAGYGIISNTTPPPGDLINGYYGYFPISYGVNADIATITDNLGVGRIAPADKDQISVSGGPPDPAHYGTDQPLNCQLFRVYQPSDVLLYGDCGTRPMTYSNPAFVYQNDTLYYTTDYVSANTMPTGTSLCSLQTTLKYTILAGKLPIDATGLPSQSAGNKARHKGNRINIVFCDGHAEGIFPQDFGRVRISPYPPVVK